MNEDSNNGDKNETPHLGLGLRSMRPAAITASRLERSMRLEASGDSEASDASGSDDVIATGKYVAPPPGFSVPAGYIEVASIELENKETAALDALRNYFSSAVAWEDRTLTFGPEER